MPEAQPLLPIPLGLRANREITEILGVGGYMEMSRQEDRDPYGVPKLLNKLEVGRWILRPKNHTVEVPCSGSHGAVEKRLLATDFKFIAQLGWDAAGKTKTIQLNDPKQEKVDNREEESKDERSAFLEDRLQGFAAAQFHVGILFALGDQRQYHSIFPESDQTARGSFYYCERVQIDDLIITNSILNPDVVRGVVRGSGSAPLRRYTSDAWMGAGGFNFSEAAQKQVNEPATPPGTL